MQISGYASQFGVDEVLIKTKKYFCLVQSLGCKEKIFI